MELGLIYIRENSVFLWCLYEYVLNIYLINTNLLFKKKNVYYFYMCKQKIFQN